MEAESIRAFSCFKLHRIDPEAQEIYDRVLSYQSEDSNMVKLQAQISIQRDTVDDRAREVYEQAVQYFPGEDIFFSGRDAPPAFFRMRPIFSLSCYLSSLPGE